MSEKTFVAGWAFWLFLIVMVMSGIVAIFKPFGMWWDRQVQLESHQYKEARVTESLIFKSQLIEVRSKLSDPNISDALRATLKRQEVMLTNQINMSKMRANQKGIITTTIENNF